ncbi:MAG: cytochrome c oxidase accessory protein CcoG [Candidatus Thiodiazotropha sp.]
MHKPDNITADQMIDNLYADAGVWQLNTGEEKIHPRQVSGRWQRLKWLTSSVWLLYFLGPYLRWGDRQAVLFDLPAQKFHLFSITILPQDLWLLALVLLFFAILLAVVTALVGRIFCGFFCFQTVWTDLYIRIEAWLEGPPRQRAQLDKAPWDIYKLRIKLLKHSLWLMIALLTGISFVAWFMDARELWQGFFSADLPLEAWITIALFLAGTYTLAGFMREQTCLWLCPYSRIQGVMVDSSTLLPTYDTKRGEPRGRLNRESISDLGDCIDCNLCVAVCPTGVDIRQGQQQGCITCALCIDACDGVMDKIGRPKGLIRYESLNGLLGEKSPAWFQQPRIWAYLLIITLSVVGTVYGISTLDTLDLKVIQHRQPMYVLESDGSVRNRYQLKILNKHNQSARGILKIDGPEGMQLQGADDPIELKPSGLTVHELFIRMPREQLLSDSVKLRFHVITLDAPVMKASREGLFIGPANVAQ